MLVNVFLLGHFFLKSGKLTHFKLMIFSILPGNIRKLEVLYNIFRGNKRGTLTSKELILNYNYLQQFF